MIEIYLVGGAVRDMLLGLPVHERDWVVVGATPEQMLALGYKPVGKDFPVFLHPETNEEYALARTERKTAPGYRGFVFHTDSDVTLEQDLYRRDLTINAIVQDEHGQLIDPCNGQADLQQKILRHISPAFSEDPVRILRIARFAARFHHLGFRIADETLVLMQQMVQNGEANALVAERVWQECERALGEKNPQVFFSVLQQCGALAVIFPEIDTVKNSLAAVQQCALLTDDKTARFAAWCIELAEAPLLALCQRLGVPNEYRDMALRVAAYHMQYHDALQLSAAKIIELFEQLDLFRRSHRLEPFLMACEADARGENSFTNNIYPPTQFLREAWLLCSAIDSSTIDTKQFTGKAFGEELRRKRIAAINTLAQSEQQYS
jgi:tRNA nucleotidyltransferase (CCA-adding enzyme)